MSEAQSAAFIDMVRDILNQMKVNPHQVPIAPQPFRRNTAEKVGMVNMNVYLKFSQFLSQRKVPINFLGPVFV